MVAAGGVHWIASYLRYVGKMAVPQIQMPRTSGNGLVEGLIPVTRDDVILLLVYHPYARHGIEAAEFALSRGARLIYLTVKFLKARMDFYRFSMTINTQLNLDYSSAINGA